ncbi:hypothetical protein TIFTF001_023306 [Ficus carica]|uniref:Uncharacterized protein n=1 Tax=Ficus carica TaxID=3494 RepID=A0AA88DF75_FICCA|nr:hypothetical protein TIFTF001_023306 [Ficus carica]
MISHFLYLAPDPLLFVSSYLAPDPPFCSWELQVERRRASARESAPESTRPHALAGHTEAGRALAGHVLLGWVRTAGRALPSDLVEWARALRGAPAPPLRAKT